MLTSLLKAGGLTSFYSSLLIQYVKPSAPL